MNHLTPVRHRQRDFFIADLFDISSKDDLFSMEHPMFALRAGDKKPRVYERNNTKVAIEPGPHGLATIHDKDVWIYCISQLTEAINRGRVDVNRVVRFAAYDFLVSTNRNTSGRSYELITKALVRLKGTGIYTNVGSENDDKKRFKSFSLINDFEVLQKNPDGRAITVEVELPSWLMGVIENRKVLTINSDYFRLRKGIDRRIYQLARKHCGRQAQWKVSLKVLHQKSGSSDAIRNFRASIRSLESSDELPDYRFKFNADTDMVTFYSRKARGHQAEIFNALGIA